LLYEALELLEVGGSIALPDGSMVEVTRVSS
jgi:hypothetical protein